jgi:MFS superfamily sulfate permease-like transporter
MHLDLGPVAVLSILTGELVTQYGVTPFSQDAADFAGEVALAVGTIYCALSIFNIGGLMRFVSYPVMVMLRQIKY